MFQVFAACFVIGAGRAGKNTDTLSKPGTRHIETPPKHLQDKCRLLKSPKCGRLSCLRSSELWAPVLEVVYNGVMMGVCKDSELGTIGSTAEAIRIEVGRHQDQA